jgi:hypothetical protein
VPWVAISALILVPVSYCLSSAPVSQKLGEKLHAKETFSQFTGVGGFWRTDGSYQSALSLSNADQTQPADVTPILVTANGTAVNLQTVHLPPGGTASISVNSAIAQLLRNGTAVGDFGSIGIRYSAVYEGAVLTEVINVNRLRSLSFTSTLHPPVKDGAANAQQAIQGLWWRLDSSCQGYVALTNNAKQTLNVNLSIESQPAAAVSLLPNETQFVSVTSTIASLSQNAGAIDLSYFGPTGAVSINGGTYDESRGFSARIAFIDRGQVHPASKRSTNTYVIPGLMSGSPDPAYGFPSNTAFHPYTWIRNTGSQAATVAPVISLPDGTPIQLPLLAISPGSTRSIPFNSGSGALSPADGMTLSFKSSQDPRSLIVSSGSIDETGSYVFEAPASLVATTASKYICHWLADGTNDTMVSVASGDNAAEDLVLKLNFGGGKNYLVPFHLEPGATRMWNVSELLTTLTPDVNGNMPPANVLEGSAEVLNAKGADQPITVAVSSASFNVKDATCYLRCINCAGYAGKLIIDPNPSIFGVATGVSLTASARYSDGTYYGQDATWSSEDSTIASIVSQSPAQGWGVAGGETFFDALTGDLPLAERVCSDLPECGDTIDLGGSGGANVNDPTPNITGVSPNPLSGGYNGTIRIFGSGFGTAPSVSITDSSNDIVQNSTTPVSDGEVDINVTISSNDPGENATITVTSGGYNGHNFFSSQGNSPTSNGFVAGITPIPAPVPQITYVGSSTNLVGQIQNVVVGQPISLQANINAPIGITGESWSSSQWSSTTIVGNYQVSSDETTGTVTLYVPNASTVPGTFYWISGSNGQSWNVTFNYCMANNQCASASVPFNIMAPSVTQMQTPTGTVAVFNQSVIGFGGPIGIKFNPTYTVPTGYNNNLQWVQLITNDVITLAPATGEATLTCVPTSKPTATTGTGLDTQYPYQRSASTQDSPSTGLSASYVEETRSFSATMYVMWDPALPSGCTLGSNCASIPVPIGYVTWGWSGDALYNGSTWNLQSSSITTPTYSQSGSYPTWTSFVPYSLGLTCH